MKFEFVAIADVADAADNRDLVVVVVAVVVDVTLVVVVVMDLFLAAKVVTNTYSERDISQWVRSTSATTKGLD